MRAFAVAVLLALCSSVSFAAESEVTFDGLNAFVTRDINGDETSAKEVRVIVTDSDYPGNPNLNRMTHVPVIEFMAGSYKSIGWTGKWHAADPAYKRKDNDDVFWHGWYLHDTRVAFEDSSGDVTLVGFAKVLSLADEHQEPQFGEVDSAVWDGKATGERVNARVLLQGGSLAVTGEYDAEVRPGQAEKKVASKLTWTTSATKVVLSEMGTGKRALKIELDATAAERKIRIVNHPSRAPMYPKTANHFVEFYDLSAAAEKPGYYYRLKPVAKGFPTSGDAFCPPVKFGGP